MKRGGGRLWEDAELVVLREEYPHKPTKEVAAKLGRSVPSLHHAARARGIDKPNMGRFTPRHGLGKTPTYTTWSAMKSRCSNPNDDNYANYGGRGISVCDRWQSFDNFLADMGLRPSKRHTLGRIDNEKGYFPENCRWETVLEQVNNRRNTRYVEAFGKSRPMGEWAREFGLSVGVLSHRVDSGWQPETALTTPVRSCKRRGAVCA